MQEKNESYSVEVTETGVAVTMHPKTEPKLAPADFAETPLTVKTAGDTCFYAAINEHGVMERSVSATIGDRKIVAALVGNWVGEGYDVQRLTRKEMMKHLRKIDGAAKDEAEKVIQAAAASSGASVTAEAAPAAPLAAPAAIDPVAGQIPAPEAAAGSGEGAHQQAPVVDLPL